MDLKNRPTYSESGVRQVFIFIRFKLRFVCGFSNSWLLGFIQPFAYDNLQYIFLYVSCFTEPVVTPLQQHVTLHSRLTSHLNIDSWKFLWW